MSRNKENNFEIRDLRKGDWVWSHKKVLFSPYVTASGYKVYAGLSAHSGNEDQKSWASFETLAAELHMGRSTVIRAVKDLEDLKLLRVERREGTSNLYYLLEIPDVILKAEKTKKQSEHHRFIEYFYETCQKTRGFKPKFTAKDVMALKRVLANAILSESELEQIALYFLANADYKKFTPSLSTLFSNGILTSLINKVKNDVEFYKTIDGYVGIIGGQRTIRHQPRAGGATHIGESLERLRKQLNVV